MLAGMRRTFLAVAVVAAAAVLALVAQGGTAGPAFPPGEGEVVRVVDGDTIVVRVTGGEERVRLIGIDTPESVDPRRPVECFGKEAAARTADLLPAGTRVRLERDLEPRDRYGRLLAYVYRADDGAFVNLLLLEEGYAQPLTIPPNVAHTADLTAAARAARAAGAGLWSACDDAGAT
jgi:micrococcal nuclease